MIRKLEIKGLNTRVDGVWEFSEDLNIITGRNGSGKTALLKLIWYSISGNLGQIISDIPFRLVSIVTDSFSLNITQSESGEGELECEFPSPADPDLDSPADPNPVKMEANLKRPLEREQNLKIDEINARTAHGMRSLFLPSFRRIEGGFARNSEYTTTADFVLNRWIVEDRAPEPLQEEVERLATKLSVSERHQFIVAISTHDIDELLTEKYADVSSKMNELHVKLSEEITKKISDKKSSDDALSELASIQKRVEQVDEERDSLFRPFLVLNERIHDILRYGGISVASGITLGESKEAIASDKLSSGEKQMLSFLCYNTFCENTVIFIDEPELSLHVDWQRRLLPTLLEQRTNNQFFIATHSPFIYAKYPDKEIQLSKDRGGNL